MTEQIASVIRAVNFHVWQPCNMHCRYCFAQFKDVRRDVLPRGHLREYEAIEVVRRLAEAGFTKINFAGGEPTLCPWLIQLIETAKSNDMTTSLVSNGVILTPETVVEWAPVLDWLAISVDSLRRETLREIGRTHAGRAPSSRHIAELCDTATSSSINLKINTVVSAVNWQEDITSFLVAVRPRRWKVMQVLAIDGQNDREIAAMTITPRQFEAFIARHQRVALCGTTIVVERDQDMLGSYVMVDPAGRFVDNVDGTYAYSEPILAVGVEAAAAQVRFRPERYASRGGRYNWERSPSAISGGSLAGPGHGSLPRP